MHKHTTESEKEPFLCMYRWLFNDILRACHVKEIIEPKMLERRANKREREKIKTISFWQRQQEKGASKNGKDRFFLPSI